MCKVFKFHEYVPTIDFLQLLELLKKTQNANINYGESSR